jgi:hypothetical protein
LTAPPDTHSKLVRAAAEAGVPYIMPNSYGIDFYGKPQLLDDIPVLKYVQANINEVQELGVNWIALTTNFWYEYSLGVGPSTYGFDFKTSSLTLFDNGDTKVNTTTWSQSGRALAALVNLKRLPEDEHDDSTTLAQFCNKPLYISSFTINQREMLESVNKHLGRTDSDWSISYQPSVERSQEGFEELAKGDGSGFLKGMYSRVFQNAEDGVFRTHNDLLGLPKEDLSEVTSAAYAWATSQG